MSAPPTETRASRPSRQPRPSSVPTARPRPAFLRALGSEEPPAEVQIGGATYRLVRVFKHDSWAATALYDSDGRPVVCKFNRKQPIGPLPMGWLGRLLARNEREALRRLDDLPSVPGWSGPVLVNGRELRNAVAHAFVPGRPLGKDTQVGDDFFPELRRLLDTMHHRGLAYVDLHKRENILVGEDGRPHLIDFQISFIPPRSWLRHMITVRILRRIFQRSDDYHYLKHVARSRPDLCEVGPDGLDARRPWWIRLHRKFAQPFRTARRGFLARLRVRDRSGTGDLGGLRRGGGPAGTRRTGRPRGSVPARGVRGRGMVPGDMPTSSWAWRTPSEPRTCPRGRGHATRKRVEPGAGMLRGHRGTRWR